MNDKSDEDCARNESKGIDYLDSDPESETDELAVESSAAELISGDEKQIDTTLIDVYSQVEDLEGGNEPVMEQGTGAEDLSELPCWKRPFARFRKKKPKPEKGVDLTAIDTLNLAVELEHYNESIFSNIAHSCFCARRF